MPLIQIQATKQIPSGVIAELSKIAAVTIGKPEAYVMVSASQADLMISGGEGTAAYVCVKSIGGLTRDVNEKLSAKICALLEEQLQIPPNRVYLNFTEVPASNWGWSGTLFG